MVYFFHWRYCITMLLNVIFYLAEDVVVDYNVDERHPLSC